LFGLSLRVRLGVAALHQLIHAGSEMKAQLAVDLPRYRARSPSDAKESLHRRNPVFGDTVLQNT
jgi:hypothetical protein